MQRNGFYIEVKSYHKMGTYPQRIVEFSSYRNITGAHVPRFISPGIGRINLMIKKHKEAFSQRYATETWDGIIQTKYQIRFGQYLQSEWFELSEE